MFATLMQGESADYLAVGQASLPVSLRTSSSMTGRDACPTEKLLSIRNLILDGQLEYAEDLIFIDDIEPQQSNFELARINALMGNNDDAISYLEDFIENCTDKETAENLIKSDFAFDIIKTENAQFYRLFLDEDEDDEDDFTDSDLDNYAIFSETDPETFEEIDQDIIDVVKDINKTIEQIEESARTDNSDDNTTSTDESTAKDIDVSSLPLHEKKQTKKLDSTKDKSSDSDENTY